MLVSFSLMTLGFTFGLLHALDADHIMAVSALNEKTGPLKKMLLCLYWALGHSAVLLASGLLLYGVGLTIPEYLYKFAEFSVGILLIIFGVVLYRQIKRQDIKLIEHRHGDLVHRHWCLADHTHVQPGPQKPSQQKPSQQRLAASHTPVFVGMLHGLAGSAPALALIPAVSQGQLFFAIGYLGVFSLGVIVSMLIFGLGLGTVQTYLQQRYLRVFLGFRKVIAVSSVLMGSYWLWKAI